MHLPFEERHTRRNREEVPNQTPMGSGMQRSGYCSLGSCVTRDRQIGSRSFRHVYPREPPVFGPSRVTQTHDLSQDVDMDQDTDTDSDSSSITKLGQVRSQWSGGVTNLDSATGR